MALIAGAILGAGVLGAGASIYGAEQGQSDFSVSDQPSGAPGDPRADPLLAALRAQGMAQLGVPVGSSVLMQASPMNRLANEAATGTVQDFRREDMTALRHGIFRIEEAVRLADEMGLDGPTRRRLIHHNIRSADPIRQVALPRALAGMEAAGAPGDADFDILSRVLSASGYSSVEELLEAQREYERQAQEQQARAHELAPIAAEGRGEAIRSIAQLQQDFPVPTQANLDSLIEEATQNRLRRLAEGTEESREALLQRANVQGFNPAAALGEIEKENLLQRRSAEEEGVARAIQLLSGQVGLGQSALGSLQQSLLLPQQAAQSTSDSSINALLQAGSINASQAGQLAGLSQRTEAQNAQARQEGTSNAGQSLANSISLAGLMQHPGAAGGGSA